MSWRQDSNGSATFPWQYRLDVTLDASSLSSVTPDSDGTNDAQVVLPATLDHLWLMLDASGNELLVTQADGVTPLGYKLTDAAFTGAASVSTRDVGIQIQAAPIRYGGDRGDGSGDGRLQRFCVYYSLPSYTPTHASFTATSPLTGVVELAEPPKTQRTVVITAERPGQTLTRAVVAKSSQETVFVWLDVTSMLQVRSKPYARRVLLDEVLEVFNDTEATGLRERTAGSDTTAMVDVSSCAFVYANKRAWIKVSVTAGTDGTDYAVIVPFRTTEGQTLNARFRVRVRDVDDT